MLCAASLHPGINVYVKQEAGRWRWEGQCGEGSGGREEAKGFPQMCQMCFRPGRPHPLAHTWSFWCLCVCEFPYPSTPLSHSRILKAKCWLSGRGWDTFKQAIDLSGKAKNSQWCPVPSLSEWSFFFFFCVLFQFYLIETLTEPSLAVIITKWFSGLHTPTSIWTHRGKKGTS